MKSLNIKAIILFLLAAYCLGIQAVNLDSIPEKKRDKLLLSMAKDVVLRYGPDYYRDTPKPEIKRYVPVKKGDTIFYSVKYLPKPEEYFTWGYAAVVTINAETGLPTYIDYGIGIGYEVPDAFNAYLARKYFGVKNHKGINYKRVLKDEIVKPVEYQTVKYDTSRNKLKTFPSIIIIGDSAYNRFKLDSIKQLIKHDSINEILKRKR